MHLKILERKLHGNPIISLTRPIACKGSFPPVRHATAHVRCAPHERSLVTGRADVPTSMSCLRLEAVERKPRSERRFLANNCRQFIEFVGSLRRPPAV